MQLLEHKKEGIEDEADMLSNSLPYADIQCTTAFDT
jgi:hypothetical protein